MRDEVRIHMHSDPAVPGTCWWAESDSDFTGGSDELSEHGELWVEDLSPRLGFL